MWLCVRVLVTAVVFVRAVVVVCMGVVFVFAFVFLFVVTVSVVVIPALLSVLYWPLLVASKPRHHDDLLRELPTMRIDREYRDNRDIGLGLTGVLWCY